MAASVRAAPRLLQRAAERARRDARALAKDLREIAREVEAAGERDVEHRSILVGEQRFRPLDAALQLITMRRDAEGALEGAAEMRRAQLRHPGKIGERDILRQMRLDI